MQRVSDQITESLAGSLENRNRSRQNHTAVDAAIPAVYCQYRHTKADCLTACLRFTRAAAVGIARSFQFRLGRLHFIWCAVICRMIPTALLTCSGLATMASHTRSGRRRRGRSHIRLVHSPYEPGRWRAHGRGLNPLMSLLFGQNRSLYHFPCGCDRVSVHLCWSARVCAGRQSRCICEGRPLDGDGAPN